MTSFLPQPRVHVHVLPCMMRHFDTAMSISTQTNYSTHFAYTGAVGSEAALSGAQEHAPQWHFELQRGYQTRVRRLHRSRAEEGCLIWFNWASLVTKK